MAVTTGYIESGEQHANVLVSAILVSGVAITIMGLFKGFRASLHINTNNEVLNQGVITIGAVYKANINELSYTNETSSLKPHKVVTPDMVKLTLPLKNNNNTNPMANLNIQSTLTGNIERENPSKSTDNIYNTPNVHKNSTKEKVKAISNSKDIKQKEVQSKVNTQFASNNILDKFKLSNERGKQIKKVEKQRKKEAKRQEDERRKAEQLLLKENKRKEQAALAEEKRIEKENKKINKNNNKRTKENNTRDKSNNKQSQLQSGSSSNEQPHNRTNNNNSKNPVMILNDVPNTPPPLPKSPPPPIEFASSSESEFSLAHAPPPYEMVPKHLQYDNNTLSNVSFSKPIEDYSNSWDMVSQHRKMIRRPVENKIAITNKTMQSRVSRLEYNVGLKLRDASDPNSDV